MRHLSVTPTVQNGLSLWDLFDLDKTFTSGHQASGFAPVDVQTDEKAVYVRAELPGIKKEDISLEFQDGVLSLTARKQETAEETGKHYQYREIGYGAINRKLRLGDDADFSNATAKFENGVLQITLPKKEEAQPKRIEIQS